MVSVMFWGLSPVYAENEGAKMPTFEHIERLSTETLSAHLGVTNE